MKEKILQFYKDTRAKIEQKWAETKLIDKYILSQMLEIFVWGLLFLPQLFSLQKHSLSFLNRFQITGFHLMWHLLLLF